MGESIRRVVQRPVRDEFLAVEQFDSLLEAQVLLEDLGIEYNTKRPHSSLGWLAPAAYAERWEVLSDLRARRPRLASSTER